MVCQAELPVALHIACRCNGRDPGAVLQAARADRFALQG